MRQPFESEYQMISDDVVLGSNPRLGSFVSLYGCWIGNDVTIGPYVEIQRGASVGDRCKIGSHSFICEGVTIAEGSFIGHGVMFTNDRFPKAVKSSGEIVGDGDWTVIETVVGARVSIGSNATILPGVHIGDDATIGAGSVVTADVEAGVVVYGNPARPYERSSRS